MSLNNQSSCPRISNFKELSVSLITIPPLHSSLLLRSGQVGVPAGPREPGNLPESLRPDRALLQHWGRGPVSGSCRRSAAAAVSLPAVRGSDGRLPAIMSPSFRAPPSSSLLLISLTLCHDQGLRQPSAPLLLSLLIVREVDLIIIMIMKNVTLWEHVCALSNMGKVLQSRQPVCEGFTHLSVFALSSPPRLNPTCPPRPQCLLRANCPCNTTPVLLFGFFLGSSQMKSTAPCSHRIGNPHLWLSGSLLDCTACLFEALMTRKTNMDVIFIHLPHTHTHTHKQTQTQTKWSNLNTGLTKRRGRMFDCGLWTELSSSGPCGQFQPKDSPDLYERHLIDLEMEVESLTTSSLQPLDKWPQMDKWRTWLCRWGAALVSNKDKLLAFLPGSHIVHSSIQ